MLGPMAQSYAFKGIGDALSKFTSFFDHQRSIIPLKGEHFYSKVWWKVVIIYLITIPISLSGFVWCGFYLFADELTITLSIVWGLAALFGMHLFVLLPASAGEKKVN